MEKNNRTTYDLIKYFAGGSINKEIETDVKKMKDLAEKRGFGPVLKENSFPVFVGKRSTIDNTSSVITASVPAGLDQEPLLSDSVLIPAGITVIETESLDGMPGAKNILLPAINVPTVGSLAENAAADDFNMTMGSITTTAKRIGAYQDVSRLVGPTGIDLVIRYLKNTIDSKMETYILGKQAVSSEVPQGLFYSICEGTDTKEAAVVPSLTKILEMEEELDNNGALRGKLAYITSGKGARILKSTAVEEGFDRKLLQDGKLGEYPLFVSGCVTNEAGSDGLGSGLVLGSWQDLILIHFGGLYLLNIDSISLAKKYEVRITMSAFFDCVGIRGTSSTGAGTDLDNYAKFLSRLAIK